MRALLLIILSLTAYSQELPIPKYEETLKFKRVYSKEHMHKNPKQLIDEVELEIYVPGFEDAYAIKITARERVTGIKFIYSAGCYINAKFGKPQVFDCADMADFGLFYIIPVSKGRVQIRQVEEGNKFHKHETVFHHPETHNITFQLPNNEDNYLFLLNPIK